jgi:alkylation response protein AidB-like acyl-CoA dehydrogenase
MVGDDRLIDRPEFRRKVAEVEVRLKALEMTQLRVLAEDARANRTTQNPAASILKIEGSKIQQATSELLMEVVGPYAMASRDDAPGSNEPAIGPDWAATIAPNYFNARKVSIYGGSNEIQKGIIAKAILGL